MRRYQRSRAFRGFPDSHLSHCDRLPVKPRRQPDRGRRRYRITQRILTVLSVLGESVDGLTVNDIASRVNDRLQDEYCDRTIHRDVSLLEQCGLVCATVRGLFTFSGWGKFKTGIDSELWTIT